jgi:tetratricopeptide (TPR) repeat protein
MPLPADDQRHLTAAEGYATLGMYLDANAELEEIDAEVRHVAEVLTVRLEIYRGLERWELMRTVAGRLAAHDPDNAQWSISLAFATRRAQSIEAARRILLEAVERLSKEPILHYNLACYECQLGELEVAKARLAHAFRLEPKCRLMALDDDDLAPLWASLAG